MSCLPECDEIIMLDNGSIIENGSYEELISNKGIFAKFLNNYFTTAKEEDSKEQTDDTSNISFHYYS